MEDRSLSVKRDSNCSHSICLFGDFGKMGAIFLKGSNSRVVTTNRFNIFPEALGVALLKSTTDNTIDQVTPSSSKFIVCVSLTSIVLCPSLVKFGFLPSCVVVAYIYRYDGWTWLPRNMPLTVTKFLGDMRENPV